MGKHLGWMGWGGAGLNREGRCVFWWSPMVTMSQLWAEVQPDSSVSPNQVAIIAGNFELAEVIKTHKDSDVGE